MKLHENLQICLLAIAARYPESTLDFNKEVLGPQSFQTQRCTPVELMERLQSHAPQLLHAPAQLVVDAQECAIYLVEQSQHTLRFGFAIESGRKKKNSRPCARKMQC